MFERERHVRSLEQKKRPGLLERMQNLSNQLLADRDNQVIHGIGFDDYIKEKKNSQQMQSSSYLQALQDLLYSLSLKNDRELIEMYKYVIVNQTKDKFRNSARSFILSKVVAEVKDMKR